MSQLAVIMKNGLNVDSDHERERENESGITFGEGKDRMYS